MDRASLIQQYLLGGLGEAETTELDRLLRDDPELRREFVRAASMDAGLRELAIERAVEPARPAVAKKPARKTVVIALAGIAAAALAMAAIGSILLNNNAVATLASSENAAWESSLPTTPGSELEPGLLKLKSGVATIRFHSGTEVVLEAPAELELVTPMRGRLLTGAAVIDVPDSAIGFVMETPDGYAVDYGTRFAVLVDQRGGQSNFEIIEGEIAVHHPRSGDEVRLTGQGKRATIADETLVVTNEELQPDTMDRSTDVIRVGTNGRTASVIRNNKRKKYIHRDILSVKRTERAKWDQRSVFAFDLSGVDLDRVQAARLRLNLVPSTRGFASRLPKVNRFGVYGLTNPAKADWKTELLWEDAPAPEDGVRLGTFEVSRSQQRGSFGIQNEALLSFLKNHPDGPVTLILVRETTQIEGVGPGLTHMFASDSHPESVGPMLEFSITESD